MSAREDDFQRLYLHYKYHSFQIKLNKQMFENK